MPAASASTANLAPRWHTAALVGLIVAVALTGTLLTGGMSATPEVAAGVNRLTPSLGVVYLVYLPALVVDWALVLYVSRVGRARSELSALIGVLPRSWRRAATDVAWALVGFLVIEGGELAAAYLAHGAGGRLPSAASVASVILPTSTTQRIVWVAFAVSAGFCEEVVYRGYLQRQLGAFSRSALSGVALSAILFGIAHLDQGVATALRFTVYAVLLGALACRRGSLVPGILCHVAVDLLSGFAR